MLKRESLSAALPLIGDGLFEIKLLGAALLLHVPCGISAVDWIAQNQDPLHLRIVAPDPVGGAVPVHINRARFSHNLMSRFGAEVSVILFVIYAATSEHFLSVEKMDLFQITGHADLRMLPE